MICVGPSPDGAASSISSGDGHGGASSCHGSRTVHRKGESDSDGGAILQRLRKLDMVRKYELISPEYTT